MVRIVYLFIIPEVVFCTKMGEFDCNYSYVRTIDLMIYGKLMFVRPQELGKLSIYDE